MNYYRLDDKNREQGGYKSLHSGSIHRKGKAEE
jgi:hypothetical protein